MFFVFGKVFLCFSLIIISHKLTGQGNLKPPLPLKLAF